MNPFSKYLITKFCIRISLVVEYCLKEEDQGRIISCITHIGSEPQTIFGCVF